MYDPILSRAIDLSDLPEPLINAIEAMVRAYREAATPPAQSPRAVGWAKDMLPELPPSFFDLLPDDMLGTSLRRSEGL